MGATWVWLSLVLAGASRVPLGAPPSLPEVASRDVEVTASIGDVSAPDRGLVALSDGSGAATILMREAGRLRAQPSSDGGATFLPEVEVSTAASRPVFDHRAVLARDGGAIAAWTAPDPVGDRALYLSRSADHGATWTPPVALVHGEIPGHGVQRFAVSAGAGGRLAVVWADGAMQSVHARVSPDGTAWLPAVTVHSAPEAGGTEIQSLDVGVGPGGEIHVAFVESEGAAGRIFTSRSTDGGGTFEPPVDRTQQYPVGAPRPFNADLEVDDDGTVMVVAVLSGRLGLLRSTDAGAIYSGSVPVTIMGSQFSVTPILTSWPGSSTVALRCVEGQGRFVFALSMDGGATFLQWRFFSAPQPGALGNAVARTSTGRIAIAWVDRGNTMLPGWESQVVASSTVDGTTWTPGRVETQPGSFQRVPVSAGITVGANGEVTVLWEDPRPDAGTTSIWNATASAETMEFGEAARVDADAFSSRPNATPDPTVASDGDRRVMAVFPAAVRSQTNDLYVAASGDGGRTFGPPVLLAADPPGEVNNLSPAAALGSEGVGWILSELNGPISNFAYALRLHRTGDFGASFPEEPIHLGLDAYEGLLHVAMADGGIGVAAWADSSFRAWLARGGGPGTPVTQTLLSDDSWEAAVCADGAHVAVTYAQAGGLAGKLSTDSGEMFGAVFLSPVSPGYLSLSCAGDEATAVWLDWSANAIRAATLGPTGWGVVSTLGPAGFAIPRIARRGDVVVAAWDEEGAIWSAQSSDGGATWAPAERLDGPGPEQVHDAFSWNVVLASDQPGRVWAFWEEELGSAASIVVRRSENGGAVWSEMRRLSREQPQHAFVRQDFPYNARPAVLPGAALLAFAGPLNSDWRSVFVNADDALDADRDGVPDADDCAPQDPDTSSCGGPPVAAAGGDRTVECSGDLGALVHLDGSGSTDPDGALASYVWREGEVALAKSAVADVTLALGSHPLVLEVTDASGLTDTDEARIEVADTQPPQGGITFPQEGGCFGPAQLPVAVGDDARDVCDPSPDRGYTPGSSFGAHGDHTALLRVQDAAGLVLESAVAFTIDTVPPSAAFLSGTGERIDPGHLPLAIKVGGDDADGASGGIVRERVFLNGCLALDGAVEGDGDGLLSDEALGLSVADVCALAARCGFNLLQGAELKLETTDCGGNVGVATLRLTGAFPAQGVCRSPRAGRSGATRGVISLDRR